MRAVAIVLAFAPFAFVGCGGTDGFSDDYPTRPGVGGIGGVVNNHPPDAGPPADGDGSIGGRVCVISDARVWTSGCAPTGVDGLTVTIGTATATTSANGSFSIMPSVGATTVVVDGSGIVTGITKYDPAASSIQAIAVTTTAWNAIQGASSFTVTTGNGSLMVDLLDNGAETPGMTADSTSGAQDYYDTAMATVWDPGSSTALNSKVLFPDIGPSPVTVTAATADLRMNSATFNVESDAITFGSLNVPP